MITSTTGALWASALSRDRSTIKGFFLADQNLVWGLIGTSLFAANTGSSHFIGLAGIGASSGIAIGAFEWNTVFMLFILGWIFVPIYMKAGVATLPEYLRKRFGSARIQVLVSILFILIDFLTRILVEVCYGAMFVKIAWDMDVYQVTLVLLVISGIYTFTGGLAAAIYTEALHAVAMLLGSIVLMVYAFRKVGGYKQLQHDYFYAIPGETREGNWTAQPECYTPNPSAFHIFRGSISREFSWPKLIFGATTVSLFYGCADQVSVQRGLAGKSKPHMHVGFILYGYLKLLPMFLMVMPGMISRIFYPDQVACVVPSECQKYCGAQRSCSPIAYPKLVVSLLPTGLQGMMLSTVCAAIISSLTSAFNSISALFTMNIYAWMRPKASENELMITARFFIITLLATTIVWIPIIETAFSEKLFEYMLLIRSCLTPPITALFILAVFSKRVNEEGAFWGLIFGIIIGLCRLVPELMFIRRTCEDSKCPMPICRIHYFYFSMALLLVSLLSMLGISFFRAPIPDKHLHGLCWSLRKSQEKRVDLDRDRTWRRLPRFAATPAMFGDSKSYFWEAFQLFFGLEPQVKYKVTPGKATKEIKATEGKTEATGKRKHSDTLEDAKVLASGEASIKMEVSKEKMEQGDTPEGADGLAQGKLSRVMKATKENMEDTKRTDMLEKPYWKKVISSSGTILITLLILGHMYFA
ncbi:PREDICTED: sodium/glucose cotransporter 1-like isoform X2 [Chinchilla lanigera]|uniref:sodium/glucose cotransporter 1-like isoform X2 n=1 Tax=Chinchilla lanigera TaxID=34839 RepID=UPI00038F1881|nr:PREDICTED: sodium/glucose cotransporter 1-like isoform X2 [Chinchilla lanigera]